MSPREGSADLGFRRGHEVGRHLVFAVLFPFVIGAVAYGAASDLRKSL